MNARSLLSEAFGSLASHPLRSALTALSVGFGAAVLFILISYSTGIPSTTATILRSLGSQELIVEPGRSRGGGRGGRRLRIRYTDLPAIRAACPSIERLSPAYRPGRGGPVFTDDRSWPWASITGVGFEYREVTGLAVTSGRWFTKREELQAEDVALLSRPFAEGLFDGESALDRIVTVNARRFRVIGVFESNASFAFSIFVPYPTAMEMGDDGGRNVSHLAFAPRNEDLAADAVAEMRNALSTIYRVDPTDERAFDIKENTTFVAMVQGASLGLQILVLAIATLTLVLGCLGAANVVGISVAERTSELGLRKALGATPTRLRAEVLTETVLLCVAGGVLGVLVGLGGVAALGPLPFTDDTLLVPHADPLQLTIAFALLVGVGSLAGLPAARRAAALDPVIALRDE
ncbi:MAG: hypothetical protein DHS20C15_26180 [Planctomycetota bacterium]|nr:MAG: hypothetical protein DHS20C15_26180 [Planctomycetota bacterium]